MSNTDNKKWILAIDPGSDKVGYAVVNFDYTHGDLGICYLPDMHRIFAKYCRDTSAKEHCNNLYQINSAN